MPRISNGEVVSDDEDEHYEDDLYDTDDEYQDELFNQWNNYWTHHLPQRVPVRCGRRVHHLECGHLILTNTYSCRRNCSHGNPKIPTDASFNCSVCDEQAHESRLENLNRQMDQEEDNLRLIMHDRVHVGFTPQQIEDLEDQLGDRHAWLEQRRLWLVEREGRRYRGEPTPNAEYEEGEGESGMGGEIADGFSIPTGPEIQAMELLLRQRRTEEARDHRLHELDEMILADEMRYPQ
ncbi:MAG: hypothetical protein M1835_006427 [Candelina submexicana]|nr:MAG: hypothetical protein M1835_006427 [Candelina submexicana]